MKAVCQGSRCRHREAFLMGMCHLCKAGTAIQTLKKQMLSEKKLYEGERLVWEEVICPERG